MLRSAPELSAALLQRRSARIGSHRRVSAALPQAGPTSKSCSHVYQSGTRLSRGIEINFMGLVVEIGIRAPLAKIPAWGRIEMDPITW